MTIDLGENLASLTLTKFAEWSAIARNLKPEARSKQALAVIDKLRPIAAEVRQLGLDVRDLTPESEKAALTQRGEALLPELAEIMGELFRIFSGEERGHGH